MSTPLPQLFQCLQKHQVRYAVCGGFAVNLYGIPRMTADIDFLLSFDTDNLAAFANCMTQCGYQPRLPLIFEQLSKAATRKQLREEKNLIAYSFFSPADNYLTIDVLNDDSIAFDDIWTEREVRTMGTININLVSVQRLITMKEKTGRLQDMEDVRLLKSYFK